VAETACTACTTDPCTCKSEVQLALDALDDLLTAGLNGLSDEDIDAIDAWANNIQLDIMRYRRKHGG
jgi:hypothetical protein